MNSKTFNIRVYGLLFNEHNQLLIVHETINGWDIVKFPGGGLIFGEGTIDCLKREFREETNLNITQTTHFYTTDFFQVSAFNPNHQVISLYYTVQVNNLAEMAIPTAETQIRQLLFVNPYTLPTETLTFPIDRHVLNMIKSNPARY